MTDQDETTPVYLNSELVDTLTKIADFNQITTSELITRMILSCANTWGQKASYVSTNEDT